MTAKHLARNLPPLPPPDRRARLDPEAAITAIRVAAGRLVVMLGTVRTAIEGPALRDIDPERDDGAVRRVAILERALAAAEADASAVRRVLGRLDPRDQDAVEQLQGDAAAGAEAMLVLLERELDRAPWDAAEGRLELLGELVATAREAARLVRAGLGAITERLAAG